MEIFKLFGSILVDDEEANKSIARTDDNARTLGQRLSDGIQTAAMWGAAIAAAAGIALVALGFTTNAADNFNKSMNHLQASTGATEKEMEEFRGIATRIYNQNLGESFDDIARAMSEVKKTTGLAGEELESATRNAIMLRDTFEFEVNESTRTANTLIKQFGITSDQAFTLIAQGAQKGANKNGDLLDTLNEYSPQFKALGFDAEQFTDVLIQGAENGAWSIDKVGDAVKEFTIRSKDLSKTSLESFKLLGLNGEKMSAAFAAGGESAQEAFQTVITKLGEIEDPLLKNQIGVGLFGTQFEDLEADAILALGNINEKANMSADTLDKINKIKYSSFGEALRGIGRNLQTGILIPLGQKVLPKLEQFSQWVMNNMPEIQASADSALGVVSGLFGGLAQAIQWVSDNSNILLPIIIGVTAAITAQMIINGLSSAYKTWQNVTKTQTTLQWLLNAALNANPLGLVAIAIGAVIAAGVLLYKNWDTIKVKLGQLKDWTVNKVSALKDGFMSRIDSLKTGASNTFNSIKSAIINPIETAGTKVKNVINKIKSWFSGLKLRLPELKFPKIKMPKFDITGKFGLNPPSVPKLSLKWFKTGGVMEDPFIVGNAGFGDVAEAIVPFEGPHAKKIASLIAENMPNSDMSRVIALLEALVKKDTNTYLDGKLLFNGLSPHMATAIKVRR